MIGTIKIPGTPARPAFVLLALTGICCSQPASTRSPPGVTMHRSGASSPDGSGWHRAASTAGQFSVLLPAEFNDFTTSATVADGVRLFQHIVGAVDRRGVKYTAMRCLRADGKVSDRPLDEFGSDFERQGELRGKRAISLGRMRGIELKLTTLDSYGFMRLYDAGASQYLLIVDIPSRVPPDEITGDANRFLDSLTVGDDGQR